MSYLLRTCLFGLLSIFLSVSPAHAEEDWRLHKQQQTTALRWEGAYLLLGAVDTAQTISCLDRGQCREGNPIWGKHPSAEKLILARLGGSLVHFAVFNHFNKTNPKSAMRFAQVSCLVQGGAVMLNARIAF